jgi:hypothetical protein
MEVAAISKREEREERRLWQHTATVLALLANCHRGKNSKPAKPADFYPFDVPEVQSEEVTREDINALIDEFNGK